MDTKTTTTTTTEPDATDVRIGGLVSAPRLVCPQCRRYARPTAPPMCPRCHVARVAARAYDLDNDPDAPRPEVVRVPPPSHAIVAMRWIRAGVDRVPLLARVVRPPVLWQHLEHAFGDQGDA